MSGGQGPTSAPLVTGGSGGGFRGSPDFADFDGVSTPGTEQTLLTLPAIAAGFVKDLHHVNINCSFPGQLRVTVDGLEYGATRTHEGQESADFYWYPRRSATEGSIIRVLFKQERGPSCPIKCFLQMADFEL